MAFRPVRFFARRFLSAACGAELGGLAAARLFSRGWLLVAAVLVCVSAAGSPGLPNLSPRDVVLSSYAVLPGDVMSVTWTTTNSGNGYAYASFTGIRLGTSPSAPPSSSLVDLTFTTPEIPAHSTVQQTVSVTIPSFTPLGTYYIWVLADLYGGANQSTRTDDITRSGALAVQNFRAQPNLRPSDVALSAASVRPGDLLTVMWTLANTGTAPCPASYTGLRLGTSAAAPPSGDALNILLPTPGIPASSSMRFTNSVTIPETTAPGTYYLWVVADDVLNSTLNQSSRADDAARSPAFMVTLQVQQPNLVPNSVFLSSYTVRPGDLLAVTWTLTNSGSGNSPSSVTGLHLGSSPSEPPTFDALNVKLPTPAIAAGASLSFTNAVTIPSSIPFGTYYLWVVADDVAVSTINQTTRADDAARSAALTVTPVIAPPNLVPQNVLLSAYSVRPGDLLSVMWTIANTGDGDARASYTGLHLGTSPSEPPAGDPLNIQLPTPGIGAHSSIRQTNVVTIPPNTPTGNYYVWVIADDVAQSTLGQSSREDDFARSRVLAVLAVAAQPNLAPDNVLLNTDYARPGDPVTVRWTMKNLGAVTCPASFTGVYLGQSLSAPPTNSAPQFLLETPEIAPGGSVQQTNNFTIPANTALGTYYVWVIADNSTNSTVNQSSRADDAAHSGPLAIVTVVPQPNLAPSNVTLSTNSTSPSGPIAVTWIMRNTGAGNAPASTTGLHLGTSATAPPASDPLNLKISTPSIAAQASITQTNVLTIPAGTPAGTYYLWVIADDVANSGLNQSSKADDATRSGPLTVTVQQQLPNLVITNVTLNVGAVPPGGQVAVMWTLTNSGEADAPVSITGLHLGTSPSAPPASDTLNTKFTVPALPAHSSVRRTNVVIIPANTPISTYYIWVVADDAANSGLNQSSKLDDAAHSGPLAVSRVTLATPASGALVDAPPIFSWAAPDVPSLSLYLANKPAPVLGTDPVVFVALPGGPSSVQLSLSNWTAAVQTLGYAQNYYWTVGTSDDTQRQIYAGWQPFQVRPLIAGLQYTTGGAFHFEVFAPNDAQVTVQASQDLVQWQDLANLQNPNGLVMFADPTAIGESKRFYRAK